MPKTWVWISGWGIQPERFQHAAQQALPDYEHLAFAPTKHALGKALKLGPDRIGGYSLGSLLLLHGIQQVAPELKPLVLAPFTAFCEEFQMGGTTSQAALGMIQTRLLNSPLKALKLFYRLADLMGEPLEALPYDMDSLVWGLDSLMTLQANPSAIGQVTAYYGKQDALTDYHSSAWSESSTTVCIESTHAYQPLLSALSKM